MLQEVAFAMPLHESVTVESSDPMAAALVEKVSIEGGGSTTRTLHVAVVPRVTVTVYVPAAVYVVENALSSPPLEGSPLGADHAKLPDPPLAWNVAASPRWIVCVAGAQESGED